MRKSKDREHRPPRDLFFPGFVFSASLALIAHIFLFGSSAEAANAANARIANLHEFCNENKSVESLIGKIGEPTVRSPFGKYEIVRFERPEGFKFEIDALVQQGKVVRLFALETNAHREAVTVQLARFHRAESNLGSRSN